MTLNELFQRFPEIPRDLRDEPVLAEFAGTLGDLLRQARMPSNCSREHDAANHLYLKLVGPLSIYGYGLSTREGVLAEIRALVEQHRADPASFAASLVPGDAASREVRGPGCD
jgi:hypothetical protein